MRMIDADALKDEMRAGCVPIDLGGITGITGDDDSIEDYIDNAPTIDAIPVEWLEAQIKPYTGDVSDIGKAARNGTIKDIIRKWQKEQEAIICRISYRP